MKVIDIDCKNCKCKTTHLKCSNQTTGETILFGIFTAGFALATREFWWKCSRCGKTTGIK